MRHVKASDLGLVVEDIVGLCALAGITLHDAPLADNAILRYEQTSSFNGWIILLRFPPVLELSLYDF